MTATITRPRVAVLGAGHVGSVVARMMVEAGYHVTVAASGDPSRIDLIASVLIPGATTAWAKDAVASADLVVMAIPLHRFATLDRVMLGGKIVVDTMNYWSPTDGVQPLFEQSPLTSSETVQRELVDSVVVKAFNHIGYHEMEADRSAAGTPDRRALGVASDDPHAAVLVAAAVDAMGYDAIILSNLRDGAAFEPGGPVFGARLTASQFTDAVAPLAAA